MNPVEFYLWDKTRPKRIIVQATTWDDAKGARVTRRYDFTLELDGNKLADMARKANRNRSRRSRDGAVEVRIIEVKTL